jgi:hypothetical protein
VECWEVDSAGDFARKKPKPPYVFRHPSQRNRRGDLARLRKFGETTPRSKVREPKQRVRSLSRSGGVSQPKSFRRFGSLPLVGNGPCGSIASCSLVPVGVPQEEVVSGGIGPQRAPPSRRFGATDYKAAAEFDTGPAGTAQTGSWVRRRKGEFRGSWRRTVTTAVGVRCWYLNLRHASMREQQRL